MASESDYFNAIIEYLRDPTDIEKLKHILKDGLWERFVAEAKLPRAEADALYGDLKELRKLMDVKGRDMSSEDREHIQKFMTEFPQVKQELEKHIGKLHELADGVDSVHRGGLIAHIVASATGVVSGILTIAGVVLAPVTAGLSLGLLAAGAGLGVAATATGVSTSIVEHVHDTSAVAEASHIVSSGVSKEEELKEMLRYSLPRIAYLAYKCHKSLKTILSNARAWEVVRANPQLAEQARLLMTSGELSRESRRQVKRVFKDTVLAMSKGGRVFSAAFSGFFLLFDVYSLVEESKELHDGSRSPTAEELREQARELESRLEELSDIYKILQDNGTQ